MLDWENDEPAPCPPPSASVSGLQISLTELFFVVTFLAVELGLYLHVSSLLAFLPGGGLVLVAAIRWLDIHNFLVGSIVGYIVLLMISGLYVATCSCSLVAAAYIYIFLPPCGYVLGGLVAELQNLD